MGLLAFGAASAATPTVDGVFDLGEYGAANSVVTYNPAAALGDFANPTSGNASVGYSIYLNNSGGALYGLIQANPAGGGSAAGLGFANLYFDLDRQNGNGSDLGFELGNFRAFIPGVAGYAATPEVAFVLSADGNIIEFSIPDSDFTDPIEGLSYNSGQAFPDADNPTVTLRLSQSFGYSVAGGAGYGTDRLGAFDVPTPEPASMVLLGAGLAGLAAVRRHRR